MAEPTAEHMLKTMQRLGTFDSLRAELAAEVEAKVRGLTPNHTIAAVAVCTVGSVDESMLIAM